MARPLLTLQAVIEDHGGALTFWLAWIHGEVEPQVQDWVRTLAGQDSELRRDLDSVDAPAARNSLRYALQAHDLLAEATRPSVGRRHFEGGKSLTASVMDEDPSELTDLAGPEGRHREGEGMRPAIWALVRRALFALLDEVEIRVPAATQAREGSALLAHLAGREAVRAFRKLHSRIEKLRRVRAENHPPLLSRLLGELTPNLFVAGDKGFRYHLSYRLYLKARLGDW